jgi:hypothetical protein
VIGCAVVILAVMLIVGLGLSWWWLVLLIVVMMITGEFR